VNKSATILHAEDDENDAYFFRRALSKAGVANTLRLVPDGQAAVDYLNGIGCYSDREEYPFPCLLITDLKMPGLSGFDLLVEIKDTLNSKQLPALVLSASVADSDKERCLQLGARGYYVKPADLLGWTALARQIKESWIPAVTEPA
jgi:CheY-like chemotaxis protein